MKYAGINVYDCVNNKVELEFIKKISQNRYDKIIYFVQNEFYLYISKYLHLIIEICNNNGIKLDILLGCNTYTDDDRLVDLYLGLKTLQTQYL